LPLVRRLVGNMLNVYGQCHLFSGEEYSVIRYAARREAEMLLLPYLPAIQELPDETVALEAWTRWNFFGLFKYEDTQAKAARWFRAKYRNNASFYNSCVYLMWEERIYQRYLNVLFEHYRSDPIIKNTLGLAFDKYLSTSQQGDAYRDLKQLLMDKVNFRIPVDEKESLIDFLLGEWIAKLREMPFYMYYKASYTNTVIWRKFAKKVKTASEKQWQNRVNINDIQTLVAPAPKPIPKLDDNQRKLLKRAYGKFADKVIEVSMNNPDATIPEIAKQAGVSERTVKYIRAEIRKKGKEKFSDLL